MSKSLEKFKGTFKPSVYIDRKSVPPRFEVRLKLLEGGKETGLQIKSAKPFDFTTRRGGSTDRTPVDFRAELEAIAAKESSSSISKYLKDRANLRNRILYASGSGYPLVETDAATIEADLIRSRNRVYRNLLLVLLIDPYDQQEFVGQALQAFRTLTGMHDGGTKFSRILGFLRRSIGLLSKPTSQ